MGKPLSPPGLVYPHKKGMWESQEKKNTKEGEKVAPAKARFRVPSTKNSFFWFTSIWVWKRPVLVEVSAPTRLGLQGSNVQRKFRKRTTLRSKSSTLNGLLYAPIQWKQYLKRTTLRRLKIPLRSICSEEGPRYRLSEAWARKLSSDKQQSTFIHKLDILWWFHTWALLHSLANARKCQLEDFCEKEKYESCSVQRTFTADAFRRRQKQERSNVVMLLPDSHEHLAFEKPMHSVPETWGRMYDVLALGNW